MRKMGEPTTVRVRMPRGEHLTLIVKRARPIPSRARAPWRPIADLFVLRSPQAAQQWLPSSGTGSLSWHGPIRTEPELI